MEKLNLLRQAVTTYFNNLNIAESLDTVVDSVPGIADEYCYSPTFGKDEFGEFGRLIITHVAKSNTKHKDMLLSKNEYTIKNMVYHYRLMSLAIDIISTNDDKFYLRRYALMNDNNGEVIEMIDYVTKLIMDAHLEYTEHTHGYYTHALRFKEALSKN